MTTGALGGLSPVLTIAGGASVTAVSTLRWLVGMQGLRRLGLCALVAIVTISCSDRREARAWRITSKAAKPAYYRDHLVYFPRGAHAAEAAAALALPVVDLLVAMDDGAVEAAMRFGRDNWIRIDVRRASAAGLTVHVAPGTTFRGEDPSYERMVGVSGDTVILADTTTHFLAVPVLSMNLRRQAAQRWCRNDSRARTGRCRTSGASFGSRQFGSVRSDGPSSRVDRDR